MKRILLSLLTVTAFAVSSTLVAKSANLSPEQGTTTIRCGHCHAHKKHEHEACSTRGCQGAIVDCEKTVVVKQQVKRACEKVETYRCPEGSTEVSRDCDGKPTCEVSEVKTRCVRPIKDCTIDCSNACPEGTEMVPGSERSGHAHRKNRRNS